MSKALVDRDKQATGLLVAGQREAGIKILRELQEKVTDPELKLAIHDSLRQAGERPQVD